MADLISNTDATVNFIVGGVYYSLLLSDIQAHKDSYFASVIKDEWNRSDEPIVIDRDGVAFRHIVGYIYNRCYEMPFTIKGSLSLLVSVRREADYYNLPELVAICDQTYEKELTKWCKTQPLLDMFDAYTMQTDEVTELDAVVSSEVYPGCHTGTLHDERFISSVSIAEAVAGARLLPNEANEKNVYTLDIDGEWAFLESLQEELPSLPGVCCYLEKRKGWIFAVKKGGYQHATTLGVRCAKHIGTALYIMNSDYTGGVITVTKNGVSKSITQPGEFILYTSDYSRTISTVTSGTLVFVKLDIIRETTTMSKFWSDMHMMPTLIPYDPFPCTIRDLLMQAVHKELNSVSSSDSNGVVLCLSTLYPIVEFDPSGPYLETDPDSLKDRDAVLYEYLKDTFAVTLVTVYVHRGADTTAGCVLGPVPPTSDKECTAKKVKIIAPFHGFRESFDMCTYDSRGIKALYANLTTALYIAME